MYVRRFRVEVEMMFEGCLECKADEYLYFAGWCFFCMVVRIVE